MATRGRKVEIYKLTISGLGKDEDYAQLITGARKNIDALAGAVMKSAEKSHALFASEASRADLRLRFMSYTTGHRPDILDTRAFSVEKNPLPPNTTGVEWTHALGRRLDKQFILAVERHQAGIWPSTIERYLQWLLDEHAPEKTLNEEIVVSIEAVPGARFIQRLNALERITKATVRTVRPNPGWPDMATEMAAESQESNAHKTDLTMTAPRNGTLNKARGIVGAIKRLFNDRELDFAAIEGKTDGKMDRFNTEKLGKSARVRFELDEQGQVSHADAWRKLGDTIERLD